MIECAAALGNQRGILNERKIPFSRWKGHKGRTVP